MKKLNLLIIVSIGLIISSCCSDDDCGISDTTQSLISITKDYYTNNNLTFSAKFNFYSERLINIQYSDNSYDDIYYEGDLISKILEFDANNDWEWTTTYTYNSSNKLIQKKVTPSPNNTITDVSRQKDFVYNGNLIQSESSWSDGGLHKNMIILNNEKLITEDKILNSENTIVLTHMFEYINESLSKVIRKDSNENITAEVTFEYIEKVTSDIYNYDKYLFGKEWKNNSYLNNHHTLITESDSYKVHKNYISNYNYSDFLTNTTITSTFNYEFDTSDNIIKQTQNVMSNGETYKVITTYEYE